MTITAVSRTRRRSPARQAGERIAQYTDPHGRQREIITHTGAHGSTLVIDRIAGIHADQRLIAHLCADEPPKNAHIVCALYLADERGGSCRALTREDLEITPISEQSECDGQTPGHGALKPIEHGSLTYYLHVTNGVSAPQLRWHCRSTLDRVDAEPVTIRQAVGALERYEPIRSTTTRAIRAHGHDDERTSVAMLRAQLRRLQGSPIVLNRGLREAVLGAIANNGLTLSEIAIRCGRTKHDDNGNHSGETSWLGRRIGILPESGQAAPTPWVHTDVLALIARNGLGLAPREVELDL